MSFSAVSSIIMTQVLADDVYLASALPALGRVQAAAHKTRLPDLPIHDAQIEQNFTQALAHVEIWRLEKPVAGGGALFVSPLNTQTANGLQLDDIVVQPNCRRQGIASAMMAFAAHIAKQRGLSFLAWECEENNPAQKLYQTVGAQVRAGLKPFRLNAGMIAKIKSANGLKKTGATCVVSSRFSLFRTLNFGIEGYDMDPSETSRGIQIEDMQFDTMDEAIILLARVFAAHPDISFADLVVPVQEQKYADFIKSMGIAQNTYSGNPAVLWQLTGDAFEVAAAYGQKVKSA